MRLIDSNGNYTLNASDNTGYSLGFGGGIISVADEYGHIVAEFFADDAPTIEAEPVKHGRWTEIDASYWQWKHDGAHSVKRIKYRHDECGKIVPKKENYCPKCGAKMDEERVALEEVVDIDAQTQRNNAAMRRVIDFVMDGGNQ